MVTKRRKVPLDEIMAARTEAGGWTRKSLARWGVPWPPPKGWKVALQKGWRIRPVTKKKAPEQTHVDASVKN